MPQEAAPNAAPPEAEVELAYRGLHGYIGSHAGASPETHRYGAGFYASVWSLIDRPIRNFQIGLPSTWLTPDNSDNRTEPLCPPGTIARDNWPERGPTYGQRVPDDGGRPRLLGGEPFPLRPAEVQS